MGAGSLTAGQVACLAAYATAVVLWVWSEYLNYRHKHAKKSQTHARADSSGGDAEGKPLLPLGGPNGALLDVEATTGGAAPTTPAPGADLNGKPSYAWTTSAFYRCLMLEEEALLACREPLRAAVEFGTIIAWFYVADRTGIIAPGTKSYTRDIFLFIFLVLTAVAAGYSMKQHRTLLLHRTQTEEWKGWMQVLFLLYHYFNAKEIYNAIRVFIAAYVWMTGFGNFSYYYRTADFGIGRFSQMMWRLNFLVLFCCLALNNSYMLYYICPMHTLFTILVYAALAIGSRYNKSDLAIWLKIGACFLTVFILWDLKFIFYALWTPFMFLMGYSDPRRPASDHLYEWFFRSSLDRYIWIYGMICAFVHPKIEKFLQAVDAMQPMRRRAMRAALVAFWSGVGYAWYSYIYLLPKVEYNKVHPYTSWIPITVFFMLRNVTPPMRSFSMSLYGWLGCITLETYIGQFHTWLLCKRPDGQPIYLLTLLPGYPLLNFALVTAIYVTLSHRLFMTTGSLKDAVVPHDDNRLLLRNGLMMGVVAAVAGCFGLLMVEAHKMLAP
ncbi:CAS1 domain-containing 1 [Micractinium conductrix]|uniref:CAS1 domain-containing 1 n=1 Tax=Micractinium conductrix TaxID=554055 RepID=A0A2P6VNL9_9CHLO|nr:CAS1 domain-containing 1 [Micractinium conductrix]|eukprot:PSC75701.1 CAS1 domain-containing 1 [Micractinium conductrix]